MTAHPNAPSRARTENEALAERVGARALSLRVDAAVALTPACRRIRVQGDDLVGLSPLPGQDLMISIDAEEGRTRRRRYTIRHVDPTAGTADLDIVLHGDGPGVRWATTVGPGAPLEALGPRGKIGLAPDASWHLFVGDDSFAPAALSMAESVPANRRIVLALQIDEPDHAQPEAITAPVEGPRWVLRGAEPSDSPAALLAALAPVPLPRGPGHAYVGGEHTMVQALRRFLIERGMTPESIDAKGYWRLGRQNAAHGEPERD
jgi:NADPH-dependent ferric siderophore reductase